MKDMFQSWVVLVSHVEMMGNGMDSSQRVKVYTYAYMKSIAMVILLGLIPRDSFFRPIHFYGFQNLTIYVYLWLDYYVHIYIYTNPFNSTFRSASLNQLIEEVIINLLVRLLLCNSPLM